MKPCYAFLACFIISSCQKEPELAPIEPIGPREVRIDPIFQPYVDKFISEAQSRGMSVDFTKFGMIIEFDDTLQIVAGFAHYETPARISISKIHWNNGDSNSRELTIFHELGHRYLLRSIHRNDTFQNGQAKSIMRGDPDGDPNTPLPYTLPPVFYCGLKKKYYIDEIFDSTTAAPNWATTSDGCIY